MRIAITLLVTLVALGTGCKKKSGGAEALAKLNELADKMCQCKTPDCAATVSDEFGKWGASQTKGDKPAELSQDDAKAMGDAQKKYSDCMSTAMAGGGSGSGMGGSGSGMSGSGSGMAGSGSDTGSGSQAMGSGMGSGSGPGDEVPQLHMAGNC